MENYYEELGISPDATQEQIERAYRWLVQKFHPDRNADFQEEAKSRFLRIQRAFDVLSDPIARKQYDEQLRGERQNSSAGAGTKKDDGPDQQNNKRKKHPVALSPFWITILCCTAVVAIAMFLMRNSIEVAASSTETTQKSTIPDKLPVGSVWTGWLIRHERDPHAIDITLKITERSGDTFKAEYHSNNEAGLYLCEGLVKGDQIEWNVVKLIRGVRPDTVGNMPTKGTIKGNRIDTSYQIEGANAEMGIELLKCERMPDDLQSVANADDKTKKPSTDNLTQGSIWVGAWVALTPDKVSSGGGDVTFIITERVGNTFKGEVHSDHERGFAYIAGTINGDQIEWRNTNVVRTDRPDLNGNVARATITGDYISDVSEQKASGGYPAGTAMILLKLIKQ